MSQNKEKRPKEIANRDPQLDSFSHEEFFENRLSLTKDIKDHLSEQGLSWRFISSQQFRNEGNRHNSYWVPHKFEAGKFGVLNSEGFITRGDLILATRKKEITAKHKSFLKSKNDLHKGYNRSEAAKFRENFRKNGLSEKVVEGTDDSE
jgi:hypothetical protein